MLRFPQCALGNLSVARNGERLILLLQVLDVLLAQLHIKRIDQVRQLLDTRSADNGRGDPGLREDPGEGNLRHADTLTLRELFDAALEGCQTLGVHEKGEGATHRFLTAGTTSFL